MKKYFLIIPFVLVTVFLLVFKNEKIISNFLSVTKKANANVLIVEGWLPDSEIKMVLEEFRSGNYELILTTGIGLPRYFVMGMNGFLIFYTDMLDYLPGSSDNHSIEVKAYSEMSGQNCAYFNIYINDSLMKGSFADKRRKRYKVNWDKPVNEIDSILIEFTNDDVGNWGDRNLFIKEIIINQVIRIPYQSNSEYDIGPLDGVNREKNDIDSYAELVRNQLLSLGIDSDSVLAAPIKEPRVSRTLLCALSAHEMTKKSVSEVKGINILSMGTHSRRTWIIYKKLMGNEYDIGIIALPEPQKSVSSFHRTLKSIRELVGIIYYWIILLPY